VKHAAIYIVTPEGHGPAARSEAFHARHWARSAGFFVTGNDVYVDASVRSPGDRPALARLAHAIVHRGQADDLRGAIRVVVASPGTPVHDDLVHQHAIGRLMSRYRIPYVVAERTPWSRFDLLPPLGDYEPPPLG